MIPFYERANINNYSSKEVLYIKNYGRNFVTDSAKHGELQKEAYLKTENHGAFLQLSKWQAISWLDTVLSFPGSNW